jgi:hypothetical protein
MPLAAPSATGSAQLRRELPTRPGNHPDPPKGGVTGDNAVRGRAGSTRIRQAIRTGNLDVGLLGLTEGLAELLAKPGQLTNLRILFLGGYGLIGWVGKR